MDELNYILMLDEGVPFGRRYGFFYNKDGTVLCLDWEDSIEYIHKLAKKLKKEDNITEKLNIKYANLDKIEHPNNHSFTVNQELRGMIEDANNKVKEKYQSSANNLQLYNLQQMYWYNDKDNSDFNNKKYNDYEKIKDYVLQICDKEKIDYEKDDSLIVKKVIETFKKYDKPKEEQTIFNYNEDVSDCISQEKIIKEFNEKSKEGIKELKKIKYRNKKSRLTEYTSSFFAKDYKLAQAIEDKHLVDRKKNLKEWAEFLIALPLYCSILNMMDKCDNMVLTLESKSKLNKFHNDLDFMSDLEELLKKENNDEEYYYHATSSGNIKSILENGLFLGSDDLGSTAISGLSTDGVLEYAYGDRSFGQADGAVVIIKKPNDKDIVRKSTEEEKSKCMPSARRFLSSMAMNDYIIDKKYIVGVVDKENTKIYNNKDNLENANFKNR